VYLTVTKAVKLLEELTDKGRDDKLLILKTWLTDHVRYGASKERQA
jgi:hypothetical protein